MPARKGGKPAKSVGLASQSTRDGGSPLLESDSQDRATVWKWNTGIISLVRLKQDVSVVALVMGLL